MRRHTITALGFALTAVMAVVLSAGPTGTAQARRAPAAPCGGWSVVPSPSLGTAQDKLMGVAALSPADVWAVGDYNNGNSALLTLVEHWDGTRWRIVPSPSPGGTRFAQVSVLGAVAALSASNIWAVGYVNTNPLFMPNRTLIEHWDGTRWSVVPSPNPSLPPPANGQLSGVTALSASDVWAVGYYDNNALGFLQTLIEHWNGSQWSIVPSPDAVSGDNNVLNAVASASATDMWAVGYFTTGSGFSPNRTLVEHWNGSQWSIVPSPNPSRERDVLNGVAVAAAGSVWAVGYAGLPSVDQTTLTEEWDGTRWSSVPGPDVGQDPELAGVVAIAPGNVWAVGQVYRLKGGTHVLETLTEQWNGVQWSLVPSPNVGSSESVLAAVARVPGTRELWAVGFYANASSPFPTLIEHYC